MNKLEQEFLNSKIETRAGDWRQSLAMQKFEYKKQQDKIKEQQKKQELYSKRATQTTTTTIQIIIIILKVCFWICFAPFLAIGFFCIGFLKAVMK